MYPLPFALQLGVDVTPKRGTALVFAPAFLDGRLDTSMLVSAPRLDPERLEIVACT